jgi:hypothetical protein
MAGAYAFRRENVKQKGTKVFDWFSLNLCSNAFTIFSYTPSKAPLDMTRITSPELAPAAT